MAQVLIAGGGIGGLAAALSLAGGGHTVTVLERREAFTELGAGIQLAPNAFHALDRLGVGDAVRAGAVHVDELRLMDGTTGERLVAMPLTADYQGRFGNPYVVVHRADLYEPLLAACRRSPGVELCVDRAVVLYTQEPDRVTVWLADGQPVTGELLVGADGIRSAIRSQLVGDGEPRVSGHTIYRSVIAMDLVPPELRSNTVTLWAGPKWHFVHYPIGGGRYLNLAATRDDAAREVVVGRPTPTARVREQFAGMSDGARRLLWLGRDWRSWVLCDRDPVDGWVDGRVILLGDAAHPMLQYAAQGACMALEDAVLLGDLLATGDTGEIPERLKAYAAQRQERTARATRLARWMGEELYHPAGGAARWRNQVLRSLSQEDLFDKVAWLHGGRQPASAPPGPC